jgi:transposase
MDTRKPTVESLLALVAELGAQISGLKRELESQAAGFKAELAAKDQAIAELAGQIAVLKAQARTNSRNSSKPPSSDGLGKPAPKNTRKRSGRAPGGQAGHPGAGLAMTDSPDRVVLHAPDTCPGCGGTLGPEHDTGVERRQVLDVRVEVEVVEHQMVSRACPCGTAAKAPAPAHADAPTCYGPAIRARAVYLNVFHNITVARCAQILSDMHGVALSPATVVAACDRARRILDDSGFGDRLRQMLRDAPVIHLDETGFRVGGKLMWLHVACTGDLTLYFLAPRNAEGIKSSGILHGYTGTVVTDQLAAYNTVLVAVAPDALRQLCGAHLVRRLLAVIDHYDRGYGPDNNPDDYCWAAEALDALITIKTITDRAT